MGKTEKPSFWMVTTITMGIPKTFVLKGTKEQITKAIKYDRHLKISENNDGTIVSRSLSGDFSIAQPLKEYAEVDESGSVKTVHQISSITPKETIQKYNYRRGDIINITILDCCEGTAIICDNDTKKRELDIYFIKEPIMCEKSHLESLRMTVPYDKIMAIKRPFVRTHYSKNFNKEKWLTFICHLFARNGANIVKIVDDFNTYNYDLYLKLMCETPDAYLQEIKAFRDFFELDIRKDLRIFREYQTF